MSLQSSNTNPLSPPETGASPQSERRKLLLLTVDIGDGRTDSIEFCEVRSCVPRQHSHALTGSCNLLATGITLSSLHSRHERPRVV